MNDERLRDTIRSHEGYSEKPYLCPAGKWTVGIGRNIDAKPLRDYEPLRTVGALLSMLSNPESHERWFLEDLLTAEIDARRYVGDKVFESLSEARQEVLVELSFILGANRLAMFVETRKAILARKWVKAEAEMLDSDWARNYPKRAKAMASRFLEG